MSKTMQAAIHSFLIVLVLWLGALALDRAAAQTGGRGAPPLLVTADVLQAKISEAEGNPELDAKGRAGLIALYHDALSNLKKIDAHTARTDTFAETMRTAPQETDLVRQRTAALKSADPPSARPDDARISRRPRSSSGRLLPHCRVHPLPTGRRC
jgi:hypothetical protein